jgi:phenylpyruvate tautomerase PptA (4-oxalocrotonate tautomerase family)
MPLVRIDLLEGRSPDQLKSLLDAIHRALVSAFVIPERDRYQIVQEHPSTHFIVQDTGLGIERTQSVVVISLTSRPRTEQSKLAFYRELCRELKQSCDMESSDVVISITTNTDADWSFGYGRAQFMTGEL